MENVPIEISLNILEYLDREDLKQMLNVNSKYRELIIGNKKLMRKLPLTIAKNWLSKVEFANNYGDFVRILSMVYTTFESFDEFKTVINMFPSIEKLKINYIYIKQPTIDICHNRNQEENEEDEPMTFENLKSVEISSKFWGYITKLDSKVLSHLNTTGLEELLIKLPMQKFSANFIEFLCKQSKLKVLQIYDEFIDSFLFDDFTESLTYNQFISSLFEIDLSAKATFQLRKLSINYRGDHRENFQKFLSTQDELEELEIQKYEDDFVRFKITFDLIRDFRVRKLILPLELIPSNVLFDVDRYVNKNVVDLTLKGHNNDIALFNLMLKIFPNIRRLRLEYMLEFPCEDLSTLSYLEILEADHFKLDSLQNIKIPKLRKLVIGNLYPLVCTDWEGITKVNAGIQEILIHQVSHFNTMVAIRNSIVIFLRDFKQLNFLKIIQNDSPDCLRIIADMKNKKLRLSPYGMKMLKEIFATHCRYDAINLFF